MGLSQAKKQEAVAANAGSANLKQLLCTLEEKDTRAHGLYTDLISELHDFLVGESDRDRQDEIWDIVVELGHAVLVTSGLGLSSQQPQLLPFISVRLLWDKDSYRAPDRYGLAIQQLLDKLRARADDRDGIPTLYVCRSSTGRLEDIDQAKFLSIEGKKALIAVRTGTNEDVFEEDYSTARSHSFLQNDLAVSLIIWNKQIIKARKNSETIKKLNEFLEN